MQSLPATVETNSWVEPIYFQRSATVDWLLENDPDLVRQIVTHNERVAELAR